MQHHKLTPRADYRQQESLRTEASATLSETFRQLKSFTAELTYFSPEGVTRNRQMKYTAHPDHAKSVIRFDCPNSECVRGDFDLSEVLAQAVAARKATATGEMCCQGWLNEATIGKVRCHNILRYKLSLGYLRASTVPIVKRTRPTVDACPLQSSGGPQPASPPVTAPESQEPVATDR